MIWDNHNLGLRMFVPWSRYRSEQFIKWYLHLLNHIIFHKEIDWVLRDLLLLLFPLTALFFIILNFVKKCRNFFEFNHIQPWNASIYAFGYITQIVLWFKHFIHELAKAGFNLLNVLLKVFFIDVKFADLASTIVLATQIG